MNVPNRIMSRIMAIPVFLFLLVPGWFGQFAGLNEWGRTAAVIVFLVAALTDLLDGYLARKNNLVTDLGKFLDPIADKLLISTALIALIHTDDLSVWVVAIIISREFIVTGIRVLAAGSGIVIAADRLGKWKTTFQTIAIVALLLRNWPVSLFSDIPVGEVSMGIAVLLTVVSGVNYIVRNRQVIATK